MPGCCVSDEGRAAERRGAAILIAWWLFRGDSVAVVRERFVQRFGPIPDREYESLLSLGAQAHEAGRTLSNLEPSQSVSLDQIPVAGGLPESFWEGSRFHLDIEVDYTDPSTGETQRRRTRIKATTQTTLGEIYAQAEEWLGQSIEDSPGRFVLGGAAEGVVNITIGGISIVRRY